MLALEQSNKAGNVQTKVRIKSTFPYGSIMQSLKDSTLEPCCKRYVRVNRVTQNKTERKTANGSKICLFDN